MSDNLIFFLLIVSFAFILFIVMFSMYSKKMRGIEQTEIESVEIDNFDMMEIEFVELLKNEEWILEEQPDFDMALHRIILKLQNASMVLSDSFVTIYIGDCVCRRKYMELGYSRLDFGRHLCMLINPDMTNSNRVNEMVLRRIFGYSFAYHLSEKRKRL